MIIWLETRMRLVVLSVVGLALAGCMQSVPEASFASATVRTASIDRQAPIAAQRRIQPVKLKTTWSMPWQLTPVSQRPRSRREAIVSARVPRLGLVRGTRTAVTYVAAPLPAKASVRNRVLEPCRRLVTAEARKLGAVRVDVASQGPDRRRPGGLIEGPVGFRILYASNSGYEVRQTVLNCRANARGRIVATDVLA